MTPKLAIPLIFALSTGTAVFAQDAATDAETDFSLVTIPFDWDEDVVDAFFSDPETGELRGEDEISGNWAGLSPEQQDTVRQYCEGLDGEAGLDGMDPMEPAEGAAPGTDTAPETDLGAPAEPGAMDEPGAATEPGAVDEPGTIGEMDTAATAPEMTELCEIVEDL